MGMKGLKIGLVAIVLGLGVFNFFGLGPRDVLMPLMMVALGVLLMVRGHEYKRENDRSGYLLMMVTGLFILALVTFQFVM